MTVVLIVLGLVAVWSLLVLPLAVAVGRAFRASSEDAEFGEIVRGYDAAGV
jgi:hypothetical protein